LQRCGIVAPRRPADERGMNAFGAIESDSHYSSESDIVIVLPCHACVCRGASEIAEVSSHRNWRDRSKHYCNHSRASSILLEVLVKSLNQPYLAGGDFTGISPKPTVLMICTLNSKAPVDWERAVRARRGRPSRCCRQPAAPIASGAPRAFRYNIDNKA
jgi:hypothetical protein